MSIALIPVSSKSDSPEILYQLLSDRKSGISHNEMPAWDDHVKFLENNPYLAWYIIEFDGVAAGSCYINWDNSIGINCDVVSRSDLQSILKKLVESHLPLPEIKSVRSKFFTVNVSPSNANLSQMLEEIGATLIQQTFQIPSKFAQDLSEEAFR